MTVLDIVKTKLNNTEIPDDLCELCVDEIEQCIKNHCKIDKVPEALKFTWANMAIDLVRYEYASSNKDLDEPDNISVADISTIKIGDTNIQLGNSGSSINMRNKAIKSHQAHLDSLIMNYKQQLNSFRRLVW